MDKLQLTGQNLGWVFNLRSVHLPVAHLWCYLVKLPNLKLKTRHKQLLGSLPLDFALPGLLIILHLSAWFKHTFLFVKKKSFCCKIGSSSKSGFLQAITIWKTLLHSDSIVLHNRKCEWCLRVPSQDSLFCWFRNINLKFSSPSKSPSQASGAVCYAWSLV